MTDEHYEHCAICDGLTGKAGPADDSIFWLDGAVGPLCERCSDTLQGEVLDNLGLDLVKINELQASLRGAATVLEIAADHNKPYEECP